MRPPTNATCETQSPKTLTLTPTPCSGKTALITGITGQAKPLLHGKGASLSLGTDYEPSGLGLLIALGTK